MTAIEIGRKLAALGQPEEACRAYTLAIEAQDPRERLEAAVYLLQNGGNYRVAFTGLVRLYNDGYFRGELLPLMEQTFYAPNVRMLKSRYERNCKLLSRYPYLFRKDFPAFDALPVYFFPFDDHGYVPFDTLRQHFRDFVNVRKPVITRHFFKDLEKPIFAGEVYSQYELEYLKDCVRPSEFIGRENHVYLHYENWEEFCSWLQVLNFKPLLEDKKLVILIGDESARYPIDFQKEFGIDYSRYPLRPVGIREIHRLIWHTQLSTHNGGDFFNEIFDAHPNLLCIPSVMMSNIEEGIASIREAMKMAPNLKELSKAFTEWDNPRLVEELYRLGTPTDKDILVAMFMGEKKWMAFLDPASRIAPALFFQPHFYNIVYQFRVNQKGDTVLESKTSETLHHSTIFREFKYLKTFTPMRRFTTSHGGTVKFMNKSAVNKNKKLDEEGLEKDGKKRSRSVVSDAISERVFNRSFMIDPGDPLYRDSIVVRFEDGKLNPKATFTALCAFLDLPYTPSMEYCSEQGKRDPHAERGEQNYAAGFSLYSVYNRYDDYVNDSERYFIEYFLRDAYQFYGYDFQTYDGAPVDEAKLEALLEDFTTMDSYIRSTWRRVYGDMEVSVNGKRVSQETEDSVHEDLLEARMRGYHKNRLENGKVLLQGLRFVNKDGVPLIMTPVLQLDPALLEKPLYH